MTTAIRFVRHILVKKMYTLELFIRCTSNVRPSYPVQSKFDVRLASESKPNYTIVHKSAHHFIGGGGSGEGEREVSSYMNVVQ